MRKTLLKHNSTAKKANDIDIQPTANSMQITHCGTPKETSKDTLDKEIDDIVEYWNDLAVNQTPEYKVGLIEAKYVPESLSTKIERIVKAYGVEKIKKAIYNYHKFRTMPSYRKVWEGHAWTLSQFLDPDKGHFEKYLDWRVVESNYFFPRSWCFPN